MTLPAKFTPPASCPRPHHCGESRFCQEQRPCLGELWAIRREPTERDRMREELDRLGIEHNLNDKERPK